VCVCVLLVLAFPRVDVRKMCEIICLYLLSIFLSLGANRPGLEADHSPPSSAEVKVRGAIPPLSHDTRSRCGAQLKHRVNFTFLYWSATYKKISQQLSLDTADYGQVFYWVN